MRVRRDDPVRSLSSNECARETLDARERDECVGESSIARDGKKLGVNFSKADGEGATSLGRRIDCEAGLRFIRVQPA